MTFAEKNWTGYCAIGIEWNENNSSATQFTIAPSVRRWDYYSTAGNLGKFAHSLSPDPSGAGYWSGISWPTGSGWRQADYFATRTYTKTHSTQKITWSVSTDYLFSTITDSGFTSIGEVSWSTTLTIPAKTSYTVSFNANGGSGAPGNQTKWHGENLTLSSTVPTRTGYTFNGWNTKSDGTGTNYAKGATYTGNAALTLYAKWTINTWTVSYNGNSNTGGSTASQTKTYNQALTLRANGFTRTNFAFKRWNTKSDDTGTGYNASASYTGNAALTLYAIWNRTVTYNANSGSGAPSAQTAIATSAITLSSTKPTRTDYVFKRWNTNTSDSGTAYNPGGSYAKNLGSTTLYAIWNPIISFNANGGSGAPSSQTKTYGTALTLSSTQPTKTGFSFKTWNTNSSGTGTNYASGASYTANTAATLYAIWNHSLTFNANGGSGAPAVQTALATSAITVPSTTPTRSGHTFLEWNTASDGTGTSYQPGDSYAANAASTTLYAKWRVDIVVSDLQCRITDSNGTTDALGHYITVSAAYDTTSSGNDCTYFGATLTVGGVSEEQHSATTGATGSDSFTFGPFAYDQITPLGGTSVGTLTASNSDGSIEFPLSTAATGYKAPQVTSILTYRETDGQDSDDGTDLGIELGWMVFQTPSQAYPASITLELTDKQTGTVVCERTWTGVTDNPATFHVVPTFHLSADEEVVPGKSYFTGQDISTKVDDPTGSPVAQGWYELDDILVNESLLAPERNYSAKVTVYDRWKSVSYTDEITVAYYTMDCLAGGHGVAFGKPSTQAELLDVGYGAQFEGEVYINSENITDGVTPSQTVLGNRLNFGDSNGEYLGSVFNRFRADGVQMLRLAESRTVNDVQETNAIGLGLDPSNNAVVDLTHPAAWRSTLQVLPLAGGDMTGRIASKFSAGVSYIQGCAGDGTGLYMKKTALNANTWNPAVTVQTKTGGGWSMGNYSGEELTFAYGTKANIDANNNTTTHTLNLTDGVAAVKNNLRVVHDSNYAAISFQGPQSTGDAIRFYANTADTGGNEVVIGAGGQTIIGSGESAASLHTALNVSSGTEQMHISSDNGVYIWTRGNTIANRARYLFASQANPQIYTDMAADSSVVIGTSSNNGVTATTNIGGYIMRDKNGALAGEIISEVNGTAGTVRTAICSRNAKTDGTYVNNWVCIDTYKDGSQKYSISSPANFRSAIAAATKTWTQVATWSSSTSFTAKTFTNLSTSGYSEVLVAARATSGSNTYLGSSILPIGLITTTAYELWLGGGVWDGPNTQGRAFCCKITLTGVTPSSQKIDGTQTATTWWVYAR